MTETTETTALTTSQAASVPTEGRRARRAFMPRFFMPDQDFIVQNIIGKPRGHKVTLGRVWGVITSTGAKENTLPDGKKIESIVCIGVLQSESYITGELADYSQAYFPMAYAEKIAAVMTLNGVQVVEVDCDIGLESTGKLNMPYEWAVTAFREGEEMAVLKRIKGSRERPASAPALAAPAAQAAIAAPASGDPVASAEPKGKVKQATEAVTE